MPEPKISIERLRRVIGEADAAHAAMAAASARLRHAREDLRDARSARELYDSTRHSRNAAAVPGRDPEAGRSRLVQELAEAQTAYDQAQVSYDRAAEAWSAVSPLATSAREYARSRGVLPRDLQE